MRVRRVERACRGAAQDAGVEIELQRQVDACALDLSAEEFLRQRRTVVGRVAFVADDGQGAVVALLSQRLGGAHSREPGTHDDDLAKVGAASVSPSP